MQINDKEQGKSQLALLILPYRQASWLMVTSELIVMVLVNKLLHLVSVSNYMYNKHIPDMKSIELYVYLPVQQVCISKHILYTGAPLQAT